MINSLERKTRHLGMRITERLGKSVDLLAKRNDCSVSALSAMALEIGMEHVRRVEEGLTEGFGPTLGDALVLDLMKSKESHLKIELERLSQDEKAANPS